MPNIFVDHKDRWLSLAESDSDFAVLFIRAWIPFNAWYCNSYPHHSNIDRKILEEMKGDANLFRTRIISLLNGQDADSIQFRTFLGQLHMALERFYIPNAANRITFTNLKFRTNPTTSFSLPNPVRRMNYKAELLNVNNHTQIKAVIAEVGTNAIKFVYNHTKYDLSHFKAYQAYQALGIEKQNAILNCMKEINPYKFENLTTNDRRNNIDCGGIYFNRDSDLLSQALIELLYKLRCVLFHGEIQPSKDNLSVYEPAYYMLRLLLKSLR